MEDQYLGAIDNLAYFLGIFSSALLSMHAHSCSTELRSSCGNVIAKGLIGVSHRR